MIAKHADCPDDTINTSCRTRRLQRTSGRRAEKLVAISRSLVAPAFPKPLKRGRSPHPGRSSRVIIKKILYKNKELDKNEIGI